MAWHPCQLGREQCLHEEHQSGNNLGIFHVARQCYQIGQQTNLLPDNWSHLLRGDPFRVPDCAHQVPPLQRVQRLHHQHRPRQVTGTLGVHPLPTKVRQEMS